MYYRIFFIVLLENVFIFILYKIRVRTSQCPKKALAGGSYRFLNGLPFVVSILDRRVRGSGNPGSFKYKALKTCHRSQDLEPK